MTFNQQKKKKFSNHNAEEVKNHLYHMMVAYLSIFSDPNEKDLNFWILKEYVCCCTNFK